MSRRIETRLIGQTIKQLRLSRNCTQDYLADLAFYSVRNIRRIENEGTTSIDVVNTFAELFEVSAIDILNGDVFYLMPIADKSLSTASFLLAIRFLLISRTRLKTIFGASNLVIIITLMPFDIPVFQCCLFLESHLFVYAAFDFSLFIFSSR